MSLPFGITGLQPLRHHNTPILLLGPYVLGFLYLVSMEIVLHEICHLRTLFSVFFKMLINEI